jgi:N utilization substance protein B
LNRPAHKLSPIEKAVLVIAAWELLRSPEVPYRVVIDEAVELAKAYGGTDGYKFVNAVLDKLAAAVRAPEVSATRA